MNLSVAERCAIEAIAAWNKERALPALTPELAPSVLDELSSQTVLASLADSLLEAGLPDRDAEECLKEVGAVLNTWFRVMMCQDEVLGLLREGSVKVAVLKGAAAAMYYPEPERRYLGDIDLIVGQEEFGTASQILLENGWNEEPPCEANPRHICFSKEGFPEIELHRRFSSSGNRAQDAYLDERIFDGLEFVSMADVGGFQVPVLPPLENGLVLLSHVNQHLGSGLGLRQILDWMFFVETELNEGLWANGFVQAAETIGMKRLAETLTLMCKRHLGLKRTAVWCDPADCSVADELLEYLLAKGNMGRKRDFGEQATLTVLHRFRNPVSAVKAMYASGCAHWEFAREKPLLAPAAVAYGGLHYLRKGFQRGISLNQLREEARTSSEEVQLFERLGVTHL